MRLASGLAALLCACVLPLSAAEPPRFGFQVGLADPQGDLRDAVDSKMGVTAGAHMTFDLGKGWMVRPRLEYMAFPERSESSSYYDPNLGATYRDSASSKITGWSMGADALYFLNNRPQGAYLLGGLGLIAWKVEGEASAWVTGPGVSEHEGFSDSKTWNKLAFTVGAGYQFNRTFGLEGRLVMSKIGDDDNTANMFQAVATFRF